MDKKTGKKENRQMIWRFLKGSKALFFLSMLTTTLAALADMLSPQIIRLTLDNAIAGQSPNLPGFVTRLVDALGGFAYLGENLWIPALGLIAIALVKVLAQYAFRVCNTKAGENLVKTMRDSLFAHIVRLPGSWHMKNHTGDIIQRCTSDIDTMKNFVSEQMTSIIRILLMLVLSMIFMLGMQPLLTVIALIPVPIIIIYSFIFHRKISSAYLDCDENEGKLSAMAQENLTGVRVVRAFGRERYEKDRFEAHNRYYTSLWERMAAILAKFWTISDILSGLQIMLVVVFGAIFCIDGRLTAGEYVAFVSYNAMLLWPVRSLGRMISEMSKAGVSIGRISHIMSAAPESDGETALCPDMSGDIVFENVSFAYHNGPEILHNISFSIPSGTTLGILGGTGSGKSTLMLLLDKLYELPEGGGRITIGGVDIADIKTEHLRRNVGIVLQEAFLFSRTIAENIAITEENMDIEKVRAAAKTACLDESIEGFTKGYDTFVGERGVTLSGGQKQRAAIARMLTQETPIMVFDDSLSAVDAQTDAKIRAALEARFGTASIVLISHRISTLSKADKIIVLEHGRIVEQGSHDELKAAGGTYQKIHEIQSGTQEAV